MRLYGEVTAVARAHTKGLGRADIGPLLRRRIDRVAEARERVGKGLNIRRHPGRRFDRLAQAAENPLEDALCGRRRRKAQRQQACSHNAGGRTNNRSIATGSHYRPLLAHVSQTSCEAALINVRAGRRLRPLWVAAAPESSGSKAQWR